MTAVDLSPPRVSLTPAELASYRELGWCGPFPLLGAREIDAILAEYERTEPLVPWTKSHHVFEGPIADALRREALVGRVASILGDDLYVWCSQLMRKAPGEDHRWHVDVETLEWTSVNVWVALKNVTLQATIQLLPRTHRLEVTPQELGRSEGLDLLDAQKVRQAAVARGIDTEVVTVDVRAGELVLFDGLLWHGSVNGGTTERWALLTQYSATTEKARRPKTFTPPIQWMEEPPACLLVRGVDRGGHNRYVTPVVPPLADQVRARAQRGLESMVARVRAALP